VAAAVLLSASGLDDAASVAGRVPDLAGTAQGVLREWARWLYGLYPDGPGGRLGSLQPDLLAETHVTTQLVADPSLARACLTGLAEGQAEQALTVLARAWANHPDARQIIAAALQEDLARLAVPASAVAVQTRAELGGVLETALLDAPASLEALADIADALPHPSLVLARASLAVTKRVRASLPPGSEPQISAMWADRAGVMLSALGRPGEALPPTQEAVTAWRELAAASPDRYRPDLARTLNNLGLTFSELGRPAEALPVIQEAVTIRRELAAVSPDRYRPALVNSLTILAAVLEALQRPDDAEQASREAQH
jgi:tetratricopeptide (TPR) repeat protein